MPSIDRQQAILSLLKNLSGLDPLKQLFWTELNYARVNQSLSRRGWSDTAKNALADDPLLFAAGGSDEDFHIVYARFASSRLMLGLERPVITRLLQDHPYALFVLSNTTQDRWHFVNVKYDTETEKRRLFRRITIGKSERLRTAAERIAMLDVATTPNLTGLADLSGLAMQARHDEAFDVEAVTEKFFEGYKGIFQALQTDLAKQTKDTLWAHDYALQFLNRVMFLYFVQRKHWLGDDVEFLRAFWESYDKSGQPKDTFFEQWLSVLFFEAFNNKFHGGHRYFPEAIRDTLALAPYLNGGLFAQNELDARHPLKISDASFARIFNFTIAEDSPLDQEVAVDPEMIGKVYESLVNVSTEADERGDAGIFYTPRTEIDLMCRLTLVDNLAKNLTGLGDLSGFLYEAVFAFEPDEKRTADDALARAQLWGKVDAHLRAITVADPACGSGSFLVGMLHVLDDLQQRANQQLQRSESAFERKKRIIGQSLYGVDVMDWAVHVAELRLWLALVMDAEFTREELHVRAEPLLPHFTFKIRCGDSLVQMVGDVNLAHIRGAANVSRELKARLTRLKNEKLKFYHNDPTCQFRSAKQVMAEELRLFRDILDARRKTIQQQMDSLRHRIASEPEQMSLAGIDAAKDLTGLRDLSGLKKQVDALAVEQAQVQQSYDALKGAQDVPFAWDIAFVEIFEDEQEGFDIIVGNPPYVRQESIANPNVPREEVTTENKQAYKAMLQRSVYQEFPRFFGYDALRDTVARKLNAKSDLYIYFYFHALALLNPRGSFCFITSNSWLDVGYGADLQEFLLKRCHVKLVMDNQVKRSFKSADVNTVIVLFSAPRENLTGLQDLSGLVARFVMFTVPFEHVLSPIVFEEIEAARARIHTPEYRVFPIDQQRLLTEGMEAAQDEEDSGARTTRKTTKGAKGMPLVKVARYVGNKWGGKYLRAPDIYWTILEKGKGRLVRLKDVAEVRFGIKSGANEFFYLDDVQIEEWGIEQEFLQPVIKSPRECKRIVIDRKELKYKLFMCHKEKKELKGTAAFEYIRWGEAQNFHVRPSCKGRPRWWDLGERRFAPIISPSSVSEIPRTFKNVGVFADKRLYEIYPNKQESAVHLATNAITCSLFLELGSRTGLGEGLLDLTVYELADCWIVVPQDKVDNELREMWKREILPLRDEIQNPSRRMLDAVIFDALNLTQGERDAVYEAVVQLVETRLKKAGSLERAET